MAQSYNDIGGVLLNQGDCGEALQQFQKCLAIRESVLGSGNPDTAIAYKYIGYVQTIKGDYQKALELHKRSLAMRESILGMNHPDTATSFHNIGCTLRKKGDYEGALEHYQKGLAIREFPFGLNHPLTARSYDGIGDVLASQGGCTLPLITAFAAFTIRRKCAGRDPPQRHDCLSKQYRENVTRSLIQSNLQGPATSLEDDSRAHNKLRSPREARAMSSCSMRDNTGANSSVELFGIVKPELFSPACGKAIGDP